MYGCPRRRRFRTRRRLPAALLPLLAAAALSVGFFMLLSARLRPQIEVMAESRAVNLISQAISEETDLSLAAEQLGYLDFIDMDIDSSGRVTSLSVKTAESTAFRRQVVQNLVRRLEDLPANELSIPLGNLTAFLPFSARGPSVRVRLQSVGDVTAEYVNEFTSAGVNQTRHSVYLSISVTVYLIIPGEIIPVSATDRVCVAETVIIGQVPDTYLSVGNGER
ncbi:MAG: sporulation protein YunB [Candidatus Enterenecus sp.]